MPCNTFQLTSPVLLATTPKIRTIDIVDQMEAAPRFSVAPDEVKDLLRIKMSEAVRKAMRPTNNISPAERKACKELKQYDDIKILQADKGKATVIMNKGDYDLVSKCMTSLMTKSVMTPSRKTQRGQQNVHFSQY